jgi:hypothetical protein
MPHMLNVGTAHNNDRTTHTSVHRAARRFLEPAQDVLVVGIGPSRHGRDGTPAHPLPRGASSGGGLHGELGIVATLREIVLRGVTELHWAQIGAVSVFLIALGALLRFADLRTPASPASEHSVQTAAGGATDTVYAR